MEASMDEEPVHTYLDDIKYQAVKGNNRRTSFVSSDHQIVAKNAQAIKNIEKSEKLVSADFRRQQNALLKKLGKLQCSREKTTNFGDSSQIVSRRRNSAPCLEKTFVTLRQNSNESQGRKSSNSSEGGNSQGSCDSPGGEVFNNNRDGVLSRQNSVGGAKFSMVEARRRSHDIQEETSKMALKKLEMIVAGNKRRATIAEGATYSSILPPSAELLNRLSRANSDSDVENEVST